MVFCIEKDDPVLPDYSIIGVLFIYFLPISAEKRQQKHMAGLIIGVA
jgi:hypothetical protein